MEYKSGIYLRLSVDSNQTGSDSLENQSKLIEEYVDQSQDICIVRKYIDDGKTGTNFKRPAFSKMMEDAKCGLINCIIVKDVSRLGRDYIETGAYIEKIFPLLKIRFISVLDGYDSADSGADKAFLLMSIKNLMHEMYALDISRKVKSTFEMKQKNKIFYRSPKIPYGYKMDCSGKNYCIDEKVVDVVKMIFQMYGEGNSLSAISLELRKERILSPDQYRRTEKVSKKEGDLPKKWEESTLARMLKNPVYKGDILRHKTEQSLFSGKKGQPVPWKEQVLIEKNHPPIISEEIFIKVQKKMNHVRGK